MKYYKIDNVIIEHFGLIDFESYPNAIEVTFAEYELNKNPPDRVIKEEEKKVNIANYLRGLISQYDWTMTTDTDYYLTTECLNDIKLYRKEIRTLLYNFANYTSLQIETMIPIQPLIVKKAL